jgi:hypothetical protein
LKITVAHKRSKEDVKQAVDRSFDDVFKAAVSMPVQLAEEQRSWSGDRLTFSLVVKMGFFSSPIKGTIDVTDQDVTIDVDLGILENMIPAEKVKDAIGERVKGLLN